MPKIRFTKKEYEDLKGSLILQKEMFTTMIMNPKELSKSDVNNAKKIVKNLDHLLKVIEKVGERNGK